MASASASAAGLASQPSWCESQPVCGAALRLATGTHAQWIRDRMAAEHRSTNRSSASTRPLCLKATPEGDEQYSAAHFRRTVAELGMTNASTPLLHVVFIDDRRRPEYENMIDVAQLGRGSRTAFIALLRYPNVNVSGVNVSETLESNGLQVISAAENTLPKHVKCIHAGLKRLMPRRSKMRGWALLKPMLHWILPTSVHAALVLDTDTVPLQPLDGLLGDLERMREAGAILGLVREQSQFYSMHARMPPNAHGFNGGLQLHDMAAMRRLDAWGATLDAFQAGQLFSRIGFSGDQNLYNGVAGLFPHMLHTVGCEWNRQLGSWSMTDGKPDVLSHLASDSRVHACSAKCAIVHFNGIKCGAPWLRGAAASCAGLEGLLQRLEEGGRSNASHTWTCPDQGTLNDARQRWTHPEMLATGIRRWFGDCCREQKI